MSLAMGRVVCANSRRLLSSQHYILSIMIDVGVDTTHLAIPLAEFHTVTTVYLRAWHAVMPRCARAGSYASTPFVEFLFIDHVWYH